MNVLNPVKALAVAGLSISAASTQNIFIANTSAGKVAEFDSGGNLINASFASGLNGPAGLAFDSNGDLYVVNGGANSVSEYSSTGHPIHTFSDPSLNTPTFIAISVPEPSTWALSGMSITALLALRRRQ
ncbi:MAG TPA: PEP-CTERM sorting domain-containing protein [Candidatus Sulfopaludibacter sp.]|nr:PEP-CTERM sorting domain-containing protein [Candidatus Sulfopaludibacter sp.]